MASSTYVQRAVAIALLAGFYGAMLTLPSAEWPSVIGGSIGAALAYLVGPNRRSGKAGTGEMLGVMLGSFGLVVMPASFSPPISLREAAGLGMGVLALEAIYVVGRFEPLTDRTYAPFGRRVRQAVLAGLGMAIGLSLLATIIVTLAVFFSSGASDGAFGFLGLVVAAYVTGGIVAGLLVGSLRPLSRWPLGTMLLGILGGIIVYGAMAPVVSYMGIRDGRGAMTFMEQLGIAVACGVMVGPPTAFFMRYGVWAGARAA